MMSRSEDRVAVVTDGTSRTGPAGVRRTAEEAAEIVIGDLHPASPPEHDSILRIDLEASRTVQDVGQTSVYLCCEAAIPIMQRQGKGSFASFARKGIRADAPCPGPVNAPLLQETFAEDAERARRRLVQVPMSRFAEPSERAAAVAFLASDASSITTANTSFLIDGGIAAAYVASP